MELLSVILRMRWLPNWGRTQEFCYQLAIAGMLHDIGKLKLTGYINGQERDPLLIEELKYVRMHSTLGYEELKDQGYSEFVLQSILYHHENYDGTGYPSNLIRRQHSHWSQDFESLRCICGTDLRQTLQEGV